MIEDMLYQENKLLIILIGITLFVSCNNKYKKYDEKEIANIRGRAIAASQNILGKENYFAVYQMANDSITNWSNHELGLWQYYGKTVDYQLDSVFCINKEGDRIVFSILRRKISKENSADGISYFYRVKIRNTWYFFEGAYMVLPREVYQKEIYIPLSFDKLKHIAADHVYRGYLVKDAKEQWQINDKFFERMESKNMDGTYGPGLKTFEECVMYQVNLNWQKK